MSVKLQDKITIACVLRSGGVYDPSWVWALKRAIGRHLPPWRYQFVCFTDVRGIGMWRIPLIHDWPGWWSKIEMFRPGVLEGRVIYFDLDTLIIRDIDKLASYTGRFAALQDFHRHDIHASGVMMWEAGALDHLYTEFAAIERPSFHGRSDLWWNRRVEDVDTLQHLYPGMFGSYKADKLQGGPRDHSVICFHGNPKQHDLPNTWVDREWSSIVRREP